MSATDSSCVSSSSTSRDGDKVVYTWIIDNILDKLTAEHGFCFLPSALFTINGHSVFLKLSMRHRCQTIGVRLCKYEKTKLDFPIDLALLDGDGRIKVRSAGGYQELVGEFVWLEFVSMERLRDPSQRLLVDGRHLKLQLIQPKKQSIREAAAQPTNQLSEVTKWPPFDVEHLEHCDVRVLVGDRTFDAHKFMLASRSPFFKAMFANQFREQQQGEVRLQDIEACMFKEVLRYIYNGQVHGLDAISDKLIVSADFLQMDTLKEVCAATLLKKLSVDNCLHLLKIADKTNVSSLKTAAIEFINDNQSRLDEDAAKSLFIKHHDLAYKLWQRACNQPNKRKKVADK